MLDFKIFHISAISFAFDGLLLRIHSISSYTHTHTADFQHAFSIHFIFIINKRRDTSSHPNAECLSIEWSPHLSNRYKCYKNSTKFLNIFSISVGFCSGNSCCRQDIVKSVFCQFDGWKNRTFFRSSTPYQKKRVEWMQNWCCIGYKQIAKQRTFKARCVLTDFIATNANVSHLIRLINIEIVPCAMRNKCRLDRTERSFRYSVSRTHSFVCAPGCQECPAWKMFSTHWNKIYNYKKCHQVRAIHKIIIFLMSAHNQY